MQKQEHNTVRLVFTTVRSRYEYAFAVTFAVACGLPLVLFPASDWGNYAGELALFAAGVWIALIAAVSDVEKVAFDNRRGTVMMTKTPFFIGEQRNNVFQLDSLLDA